MNVQERKSEGLVREYALTLPADEIAAKIDEKLTAARADFQMKGFRKGKAPLPLMKKMFGKSILGEVVQESVDGAVREHFEQTGDRPALQPDVKIANTDYDEAQDLEVEIAYEKLPEVPEVDFGAIKLTRPVAEVAESEVEEALGRLAESAQDFEAKPEGEAAAEGDQVVIDFVGRIDGEPFEGGAGDDFPLVIGSNQFIPGFEPQLIGAKAGEEKDVTVSFPEDYQAAHLAGKEAVFSCTVKEVRAPKAAEIDDELAKKFGLDDLESMKTQLRERLSQEYAGASRQIVKRALLDALDGAVSFELPPSLVDAEAKQIAHQLWHEENPEHQGHDHPEIEPTAEHRELAERRVRLGLLLAEVGQRAEVQVGEQELNQAVMNYARSNYPGQEQAFFQAIQQNEQVRDQILQQVRAPVYEDKVVDYMLELTTVEDETVDKEELQKRLEALDAEDQPAG